MTASRSLSTLGVLALGLCQCAPPRQFQPTVPASSLRAEAPHHNAGPAPGPPPDGAASQVGLATWYGGAFAGKKTSSGERFDPNLFTAAHRSLPFGTWVEVRRVDTGRAIRVRINDRGPWGDNRRIIDLSKRAAQEIDLVREGLARVELRVVQGP